MATVKVSNVGDKATVKLISWLDDDMLVEDLVCEFVTTKAKYDAAVVHVLDGADIYEEDGSLGDKFYDVFDSAEDYYDELQDYCNTK